MTPRRAIALTAGLTAALAGVRAPAQGPDDALAAVREAEARRVATIARCAPAVCSVMDMESPGGGSGVVFDPAGYVLTNYHVVGQPDTARGKDVKKTDVLPPPPAPPAGEVERWRAQHPEADESAQQQFEQEWQEEWRRVHWPRGKHHWRHKKVGLPDGELYEAVVLGVDPGSDLAVLRLVPKRDGQTWPHCTLGDSDALLVGETVFAMGNPFLLATDFTPTVTFGIVSGTHRYQEGQGNRILVYPDCIQVDAPVNPGNSGGPLFNERGEVVGINGRISIGDRGRVNVGVGFAISSNQIANFLGDLLAGRHAEHGTLDMSAWFMDSPGDGQRRGVFVQQIYRDSVVAAAGVQLGDELVSFDGERIRSANQLATLVGVLPAGAWVTLGWRPTLGDGGHGDPRTATVRLAALDTGSSADAADGERLASEHERRLATAALRARLVIDRDSSVESVDFTLTAPDGGTRRYRRSGDRLRLDLGELALVRTGPTAGFAVASGQRRELLVEERALLERELAANPLLWLANEHLERLADVLLDGGSLLLGAPAWRFAHPGEGELATMLPRVRSTAGAVAGWSLRDPVRRAVVETHVRGDRVLVVVDGAAEAGWTITPPRHEPLGDDLFEAPR
ncbi:MAG: S1C family serine protease [Planctomycetota bacterium]